MLVRVKKFISSTGKVYLCAISFWIWVDIINAQSEISQESPVFWFMYDWKPVIKFPLM